MSSAIRPPVTLAAAMLAIGLTTGAAFLVSAQFVSARDGLLSAPDICTTAGSEVTEEAPFLAENRAAMLRIMSDMAVKPTGDVDADFVAMMVPHYQGAIPQVLEAAVTGLVPMQPYVLALAPKPDGSGSLEPLAAFNTNPAGAAIVNAVGPIRQIVRSAEQAHRRYLVIVPGTVGKLGEPVQLQAE